MVGAKRRALHGVEHSSKLGCVMAARIARVPETARHLSNGQERLFPDDLTSPSHSGMTRGRADNGTEDGQCRCQTTDGQLGRERPASAPWGEVGGQKVRVAHALVHFTDTSAL